MADDAYRAGILGLLRMNLVQEVQGFYRNSIFQGSVLMAESTNIMAISTKYAADTRLIPLGSEQKTTANC